MAIGNVLSAALQVGQPTLSSSVDPLAMAIKTGNEGAIRDAAYRKVMAVMESGESATMSYVKVARQLKDASSGSDVLAKLANELEVKASEQMREDHALQMQLLKNW